MSCSLIILWLQILIKKKKKKKHYVMQDSIGLKLWLALISAVLCAEKNMCREPENYCALSSPRYMPFGSSNSSDDKLNLENSRSKSPLMIGGYGSRRFKEVTCWLWLGFGRSGADSAALGRWRHCPCDFVKFLERLKREYQKKARF